MYEEFVKMENNMSIRVTNIDMNKKVNYKAKQISKTHIHKEFECIKVNKGIFRCVTPNDVFFAEEGDILFLSNYIPHSTFRDTDDEYDTMIQFKLPSVSDSITRYIARFANVSDAPAFLFKNNTKENIELKKYFNTIINECIDKNPFWNDFVHANLLMLIASLHRYGVLSDSIHKNIDEINKLRPILEYIDENYSEELSTLKLSQMLNFNETYFCRLFKNTIGTNATNYINFVRVCKAEKLLKKDISILDIAHETGFSSISYFNRVFKKYNHYSPSEYRKILSHREFEQM